MQRTFIRVLSQLIMNLNKLNQIIHLDYRQEKKNMKIFSAFNSDMDACWFGYDNRFKRILSLGRLLRIDNLLLVYLPVNRKYER